MANSPTDTNPVWSSTNEDAGPCLACGGEFAALTADQRIMLTHCGGTGAICINKATGQTCSCGTAPDIGDFPYPVKDVLIWGDGAYGLSTYPGGPSAVPWVQAIGTATAPVFPAPTPTIAPPWTNLFALGPDRIAISGTDDMGRYKVTTATVNSIAEHTCCD